LRATQHTLPTRGFFFTDALGKPSVLVLVFSLER
jgi:hypothetical protein